MLSPSQHASQLLKKSWRALASMKRFILLPILCGLLDLMILGAILTPLHRLEMLQQPLSKLQWEYFAFFFLLYLVFLYFTHLLFYFSYATLLNGLNTRIEGGKPRLSQALALSLKRYPALFAWVTFASTAGFFYRLGASRTSRLAGQTWPMATYFVIPTLLEENLRPLEALSRSAQLMTKTWGAPVMPRFRIFAVILPYFFLCLIPIFVASLFSLKTPLLVGLALSAFLFFMLSIFYMSARTILMGNLYRYAKGQKTILKSEDQDLLKSAFIPSLDSEGKQ